MSCSVESSMKKFYNLGIRVKVAGKPGARRTESVTIKGCFRFY